MRELLDDIFASEPVDPVEAARRATRPHLRRRFYERAEAEQAEGEFRVVLDDRPVRTPARRVLAAPTRALAEALAAEWQAQGELIDPAALPLTRLANSIIDGVADAPAAVAADVEKYLACDLVLYRAEAPAGLIARQEEAWDPLLAWARDVLNARFEPIRGMTFVAQPAAALAAACAAIPGAGIPRTVASPVPEEAWRLGAVHAVTTLTGSALIALALAHGAVSVDSAWAAAHVDEDWNMDFWGRDAPALERRARRFAEMQAAATVLRSV
jgi:chaperone required for assembly of F1-ATPase